MKLNQAQRALVATGLLLVATAASAQQATIKILVGFPPGGAVDVVARTFADQLRQLSGATVIVDNRQGAAGKIAIDTLLAAPADGNTLAVIPASVLALTPQVVKSAKYDSVRDFTPVGSIAEYGFGFAAGTASKATTFAAYREWAKANPKNSSYATPGLGTPQHFLGAQLEKTAGIDLTHVPYRGGAASVTDVLGGQVPLLITTEQVLVPYEGQGKLHTLFITSARRNPKMPNVPTAREVGLPQLESTDWFGLFAKAGTPPAKVAELRALLAKVIVDPKYVEAMRNAGYPIPASQPHDFPTLLNAERAAWTERVKASGFTAAD